MGFFRLKIFMFLMVFAAMVITLLPPLSSVFTKQAHIQHVPHHTSSSRIHHNVKDNSWSLIRDHKLSLRGVISQLRFVATVLTLLTGCMVSALTRLANYSNGLSVFSSKPFPLTNLYAFNGVFLI